MTTNVTSHQSGHWGYGGWDDYGFTVSDVGSSTEDGDVGFYSSQESWSGSYTYQGNGGYSRTETYPGGTYTYPGGYTYVVPGTTISGSSSYTFLGHWTYSGSAEYDQAYDEPGETYVSSYDYDHVTDGTTTGHSEGSSSYGGPGGSSSMSYVGDSTGSTHDEWHTTTLSGSSGTLGSAGYVSGWVSDHSEVHSTSSSSSWTQTSTVNGTSSTTSGSYSSSTSTPSSSHTETGTVPSGPPAPPTYSGPDEADFDTLLTALAADAAGAYTSPTTRAAATDAAIASFTAVDDDGSGTTGGVIYTALSEAPEGGAEGGASSGADGRGPSFWDLYRYYLYGRDVNAARQVPPEKQALLNAVIGNANAARELTLVLNTALGTHVSPSLPVLGYFLPETFGNHCVRWTNAF